MDLHATYLQNRIDISFILGIYKDLFLIFKQNSQLYISPMVMNIENEQIEIFDRIYIDFETFTNITTVINYGYSNMHLLTQLL
jgi:hypothetical protein